MVVGFEVVPCNVVHNAKSLKDLKMYGKYPSPIACDPTTVSFSIKENQPIVFTYEVAFEESDIKGTLVLHHELDDGDYFPCWYCPCNIPEDCQVRSHSVRGA
ncbi:hypothetical protein LINPERPRIM_LOCUS20642 [Linum perenne]